FFRSIVGALLSRTLAMTGPILITAIGAGLPGLFMDGLAAPDVLDRLRSGLIANDAGIEAPFGAKPPFYADSAASGPALMQVETFILEKVLPYYANSHTQASYCGGFMTRLREEARAAVGACCGAGDGHAVIFTGSGATAG